MKGILRILLLLGFAIYNAHLSEIETNEHCQAKTDCENNDQTDLIDESLNYLDQEDPVLIEAVKKMIIPPLDKSIPYNLGQKDEEIKMSGQYSQVSHLIKLFGFKKRDGFFIEAGAHDGVEGSNTLYFEKKMGWKGILIEPNPFTFKILLNKQRKAFAFGHCLSTKTHPETVDFDVAGVYGGIIHEGKKLLDDNVPVFQLFDNLRIDRKRMRMQCFPLYTVLQAIGNPPVDVFSLDIEGAEFEVLKSIPWDKVNIKVLLLEVSHIGEVYDGTIEDFDKFLEKKGFNFYKSISADNVYIHKDFKILEKSN